MYEGDCEQPRAVSLPVVIVLTLHIVCRVASTSAAELAYNKQMEHTDNTLQLIGCRLPMLNLTLRNKTIDSRTFDIRW